MRGQDAETLARFMPTQWGAMSIDQRKDAVQRFENNQAAEQGRPACVVAYQEKTWTERVQARGHYNDGDEHCIVLNEKMLTEAKPGEVMETLAHEGRHGTQFETIKQHNGQKPAGAALAENAGNAVLWKTNFNNYINAADNYRAYRSQAVEADADAHAKAQLHKYEHGRHLVEKENVAPREAFGAVIEADRASREKGVSFDAAFKDARQRQQAVTAEKTGANTPAPPAMTFGQPQRMVREVGVPEPLPEHRAPAAGPFHGEGAFLGGAVMLGALAQRGKQFMDRRKEKKTAEKQANAQKRDEKPRDAGRDR